MAKNNMSTTLIIVADSGLLKAYRISQKSLTHKRKAELVKSIFYEQAHKKLGEIVSDQAGRFRGSGGKNAFNGSATGEEHNLVSDLQKKVIKHLATDIESVVKLYAADAYHIALSVKLYKPVLASLKKDLRTKFKKTVNADLTKETVAKLRERFKV